MLRLRDAKGFTLIELAIVLVIIGIILGAVLKGQDLIEGAKAKRVIAFASKWEAPIWTFYDKKGYFPGDTNTPKDGSINSFASLKTDLDTAKLGYPSDSEADVTISINELANTATQLDRNQDGTESGLLGRVRNCGAAGLTAAAAWPATGTVAVTYFFDKVP